MHPLQFEQQAKLHVVVIDLSAKLLGFGRSRVTIDGFLSVSSEQ
jgi:hypothetical protein